MMIIVNIMTLCYKGHDQTSCSPHSIGICGVAGPTTGMSPGGGHDILKFHGVTPHHICENLRLQYKADW